MNKIAPAALLLFVLFFATVASAALTGSKHDLTRDEREVYSDESGATCTFCHIPHGAAAPVQPLWVTPKKGAEEAQTYPLYTWEARPGGIAAGKPHPGSLNCLTCHDGTIGPGIPYALVVPGLHRAAEDLRKFGSAFRASPGPSARKDFFGDHPVNTVYRPGTAGLDAVKAAKDKGITLFGAGEDVVECASCHNPHTTQNPFMLEKPVNELCAACHAQRSSGKHVLGLSGFGDNHPVAGKPDPFRPGKDITCATCHNPHAEGLRAPAPPLPRRPETLCLRCHEKIALPPPGQ